MAKFKFLIRERNHQIQWSGDITVTSSGLRMSIFNEEECESSLVEVGVEMSCSGISEWTGSSKLSKQPGLHCVRSACTSMPQFSPREVSPIPLNAILTVCSGSETHHVNFFNVNGTFLNSIEPSSSILQTRSHPIATTAFHPHHMMLACSSLHDRNVNLFTCQDKRDTVQEF